MFLFYSSIPCLLLLAGAAVSLPSLPYGQPQQRPLGLGPVDPGDGGPRMVLPIFDSEPLRRRREIERKQEGFLYGTSLLGNTSYFPSGDLGNAMVQRDQEEWYADAEWLKSAVYRDAEKAGQALYKVRR